MSSSVILTLDQLENRYDKMTSSLTCKCTFATPLAGGQPAKEDGVRGFVQHHLKLTGDEAEAAVRRIMQEELGSKPVPSEEGELEEKMTYGVNVIRQDKFGLYLGCWMIHANLKNAASRLGIFKEFRGSKGDFSEAAKVSAVGASLLDPTHPNHIYLIAPDGLPAKGYFEEISGRVQTPKGSMSIIHHTQFVPEGTLFEYKFQYLSRELTENDAADILALSMVVGLGSVRALDFGKFKIESATIVKNKMEKRNKKTVAVSNTVPVGVNENESVSEEVAQA